MLIKCPECGHQVSERAPVCPTCGVQIAGKITRCPVCGETYFTADGLCPVCQTPVGGNAAAADSERSTSASAGTTSAQTSQRFDRSDTAQASTAGRRTETGAAGQTGRATGPDGKPTPTPKKKQGKGVVITAFVFAVIVFGGLFYFYQQAQSDKEDDEYSFAMRSSDPEVLKAYLARFSDAPTEHRDSIEAHLMLLEKGDEDWQNAVISGSRAALQQYIDRNPGSVHVTEARVKIDSLDWLAAQHANTLEAVQTYTTDHPDGRYIDEANILLSKIKSTTVQSDERTMVTGLFRQFFQSINSKDEDRLTSTVGMVIDTFLGKTNATSSDVLTFLHKLYKDDVTNMNWHIDAASYKIEKREVAEEEYEYDVTFAAAQDVERGGETVTNKYRVQASVSSDGKISGFNLTKLN